MDTFTQAPDTKRLYRSETNRVFAGVIGGLGEYVHIDPVLLRLIWILIVIFTGFVPGVLAYIIAIFVIPKQSAARVHAPASEG
jgi:phage shock protein C